MTLHHPSEASLLSYAAGTLPAPPATIMRTHLALCGACRGTLRLAADALSRTLRRLGESETEMPALRPPVTVEDFATGRWWWLGPGIRLMPLIRRDHQDARLDLIRVAPGMALPGHGHTGSEIACVLQGAFGDETGEYHAGDVAESGEGLEHWPTTLRTERDCVCLIATTGRLRAHSWLVRLMQPVFGI